MKGLVTYEKISKYYINICNYGNVYERNCSKQCKGNS